MTKVNQIPVKKQTLGKQAQSSLNRLPIGITLTEDGFVIKVKSTSRRGPEKDLVALRKEMKRIDFFLSITTMQNIGAFRKTLVPAILPNSAKTGRA